LAGISLVFSAFSTPLLSTMLTLAAFFAGHLTESLLLLRNRLHSEIASLVLSALYHLLPNLELFNIRTQIVHHLPLSNRTIVETSLYWLFYVSTLLLLSILIFRRKDLT